MNRALVVASATAMFCAVHVSAGPKEDWIDLVLMMFSHEVALASLLVDVCGEPYSESKTANVAAYERVRADNLAVFLKAETHVDFSDYLNLERARLPSESPQDLEKACAQLPQVISALGEQAPQLGQFLFPR